MFRAALILIAILVVAAAGARAWARSRSERALATGAARWIWLSLDIGKPSPLRFYAGRDFVLDKVPASAKARLFVDRRGSLISTARGLPPRSIARAAA